jgi:tetratricopeptide (TPR) repeat protein
MRITGKPRHDEIIRESHRQFVSAERALRERLREDPVGGLDELIKFYSNAGRVGEAITCLRERMALTAGSESKAADLTRIGELHSRAEEHAEAMECFLAALELKPSSGALLIEIQLCMGECLLALQRCTEAEEHLRKALQSDSILAVPALRALGRALAGQGRWAEAAACYAEGWRINRLDRRCSKWLVELVFEHPELEPAFAGVVQEIRAEHTRILV